MQIIHFILDKIMKLLTYYRPFCHQSLQSYVISKKQSGFLAHPVNEQYFLCVKRVLERSDKSQPSSNRYITRRWDKMVRTGVWFANVLKERY